MKLKALALVAMIAMQHVQAMDKPSTKPFYQKASTYLYLASAACGIGAIWSLWKTGGSWPTKNPTATSFKERVPGLTLATASVGLAVAARNPKVFCDNLD